MVRYRISVPTRALHANVRTAIERAMQVGARGVQFDLRHEISPRDYGETARRQLLHALKERSLEPASAEFPLRSPLAEANHLDQRIEAIRAAIVLAAQLRLRVLTLACGPLPCEEAATERAALRAALSDLAAHGNREGVTLCLTPCGENAAALRSLIDTIRTGPVSIDADLAAWLMSGHAPAAQLREAAALVGQIEARDALRGADGVGREVPLGRGEIDWDEIAALLGELDYRSWLNVRRAEVPDRVGDITRAIQYLQNLFLDG